MNKIDYRSLASVLWLLLCVCDALDICNGNKCKHGALCLPLDSGDYKCQCSNGYKGKYCDEKSNSCEPNPCENSATCTNSNNEYKCHCLNGWYGNNCQLNADDCALKPCKNGGICRDLENHKYICECPTNIIGMHCEHTDPCAEANPCGINGSCVGDNSGGYKCHCNKGFMGSACSTDIDECVQYNTGLCENGGKCVNTIGSYRCECLKGYSGERCADDIIDCKNDTCLNGGTCLDKIGHFKCVCTEHFRGTNCEIPRPICETKPCKNNGECQDYGDYFDCICPKPWTGKICEKWINPCSQNSCANNGFCEPDGLDTFKCVCKPGYNGKFCETKIDECMGIKCQNKGVCKDLIDSWRCKCPVGFSGRYCEKNFDECALKPCRNFGRCIDLVNDYKCICPSGLRGKNCEINIDECANRPCLNGARCDDRIGGFTCHCPVGFVGLRCETRSDVCTLLLPCKNKMDCHNDPTTNSGYVCLCPEGAKNSSDCSDEMSSCTSLRCDNGGRCINDGTKERCLCSPGFFGLRCDTELDECRNNPCQHGSSCQDLVNDYLCHCPVGYKGKNCETNIDECTNNPCGLNGECIDDINGYRCKCFMPFYGPTCSSKLDPCKSSLCSNDAVCVPSSDYKSYHCNCSTALGRFEGPYCDDDVNECSLNQSTLRTYELARFKNTSTLIGPCQNMGLCINTMGSYICKCPMGYDGKQCDINHDDCDHDQCSNGASCIDQINGYKCQCRTGFVGEHCEREINECESSPCKNGAKCDDHVNDYHCHCLSGFSGKNCDINDDDCTELSCSGHGTCLDKVNDFECKCSDGYKGKNCEHHQLPCDFNRCLNNGSCTNRYTKNNETSYLCHCRRGFSGPSCEIKMDWCRGSPCGDNGVCIPNGDGYKCQCSGQYLGERCEIEKNETCEKFDNKRFKKRSIANQICLNNGFCFNQPEIGGFKCSCPSGYGGTFCETNIDDCASQPCLNGGECEDSVGMYSCKCLPGFQGVNCQVNFNECSSKPCSNGKCVDLVNNYTCVCPRGTSGRSCDIIKDNCKENKCLNGGQCGNGVGDIICECKKGFIGKYCEVNVDECRYSIDGVLLSIKDKPYGPCSPSGTISCIDGQGDYQCLCRPGFKGRLCQSRIDVCQQMTKMGKLPCFNGGMCHNQFHRTNATKHGYRCLCPSGFGGKQCQFYNERCQLNVCQNGGTCRPTDSGDKMSFVCECLPGVGGLFCEKDYVNECEATICYNGGTCLDGMGKALCKCLPGFCGDKCQINDAKVCNSSASTPDISYMEELSLCHRHNCIKNVNNKRCDPECNNLACGFDGGECLHKVPMGVGGKAVAPAAPWSNCTIIQTGNIACHHRFMNDKCDPQCNTEQCLFDGWDCEKTIQQCQDRGFCDAHYGDRQCQSECNTVECDFDGGDCLEPGNSNIAGAIVLILPVPTTVFVRVWQLKLLQSLSHLLHAIVRVKKQESGEPMIFPIRVFVDNVHDDTVVRQRRSAISVESPGRPGTKIYLEIDNNACKSTNTMCFDNSKAAAEFVSAALYTKSYRPPIPILSVQSDNSTVKPIGPVYPNMAVYVILVLTCIIVLGLLVGVLNGFNKHKLTSEHPKTKRAETWFPEGMKRFNQSASQYYHRRLGANGRKKNENTNNGIYASSELGILPQMMKSKTSNSDSMDDSGSNSLTSTRATTYDVNFNETVNDTSTTSDNCLLLSCGDVNCNFAAEKHSQLHSDLNQCASEQPNLEKWCFNAFVNLLISGNGLGDLSATDSRDKEMIMEKLFYIARNNQSHYENPNMFTGMPNKKEFNNDSLITILTTKVPHTGETLLHLAAKFNQKEAARFLLESGSDPNNDDDSGRSCLLTAIDAGAVEVATYILEQQNLPVDLLQKGPGGTTSLMQAVKGAHLELIQIILQHALPDECDLNVTDNCGRTALHWASATNQQRVVQLLLSYGLNRDAQDNEEMTPLYLACREGSLDVCKILISNGANPDLSDHLDKLPLDMARSNNFHDIVALLEDYVTLTKENQSNRSLIWNQYSYCVNNHCYQNQPIGFKNALYPSPYALNQLSGYACSNIGHNSSEQSSLATVSHSNHLSCYRDNPTNPLTNGVNNQKMCANGPGTYLDYCINGNGTRKEVPIGAVYGGACGYGVYQSNNNNAASGTFTPSPDSESPGHWSTSSPSLSPRSRNQQHLPMHFTHQLPLINQLKSSVLHYRPSTETNVENSLQTNKIYGFHSNNSAPRY